MEIGERIGRRGYHFMRGLPDAVLEVAQLSPVLPNRFLYVPERPALDLFARDLAIISVRKLRFEGTLACSGKNEWHLAGRLGASVVQQCVISLGNVRTRIDAEVTRLYTSEQKAVSAGPDSEIPANDSLEPLSPTIDVHEIAHEALALELPLYPRIEGAVTSPVSLDRPESGENYGAGSKPFAALGPLREKLGK